MLTMEQIYHIRFEHREKGKSLRRIAQETGFNFRNGCLEVCGKGVILTSRRRPFIPVGVNWIPIKKS